MHRARVTEGGLELLEEVRDVAKAPTVTVWIAQPGGRSDEAVEKLTELGVARIGGLVTDLLKGSLTQTRMERWRRCAEAAAKQSKQVQVPEIMRIAKFAEVLSPEAIVLNQDGASGGLADRVVGRRAATLRSARSQVSRRPSCGWAGNAAGRRRHVRPVVLRTETAAIVAAALTLPGDAFAGVDVVRGRVPRLQGQRWPTPRPSVSGWPPTAMPRPAPPVPLRPSSPPAV